MIAKAKAVVSDENLIAALKKAGLMSQKQENDFIALRASGESIVQALDNVKIDLEKVRKIQSLLKNKSMHMDVRGEMLKNFGPSFYDKFRDFVKNPKVKYTAAIAASVLGIAGTAYGIREYFGSNAAVAESEARVAIYAGVDEKNWTSEQSRASHMKNVEGMLRIYADVKEMKDEEGMSKMEKAIMDYVFEVQAKDPSYFPTFSNQFDKTKAKYGFGN